MKNMGRPGKRWSAEEDAVLRETHAESNMHGWIAEAHRRLMRRFPEQEVSPRQVGRRAEILKLGTAPLIKSNRSGKPIQPAPVKDIQVRINQVLRKPWGEAEL